VKVGYCKVGNNFQVIGSTDLNTLNTFPLRAMNIVKHEEVS
jgi:hypothetical protein